MKRPWNAYRDEDLREKTMRIQEICPVSSGIKEES